jgi:uncharacterized repeat protein (TIGR02543 family)
MASCITSQWAGYAPQVKLTVTQTASTETTATLSWTLQYIASSAASTNGVGRAYTVKIGGAVVKESTFNINGKTGTHTIASGTKVINKGTSAQAVSFSVSFAFQITWSGVSGGTKTASGSISVAAKTSYKVSYNANGGSGAPSAQTKWHGTTLKLSTSKPTRTGYTFAGWATSASGSVAYAAGANYTANTGATLYAKWTAITYKVTYNANGGTNAPAAQTKTYGTNLTLTSSKPTRTNYTFKGWGTSASSTTIAYAAGASYTANAAATLYAIWELAYTKPRIFNVSAQRCNSDGTQNESGTNALVSFEYEADQSITSCKVLYKEHSATSWNAATVSTTATSGTVNKVITATFSIDKTYDVRIEITDSETSYATATLSSMLFPVDVMAGGKGVSFGKAAELENTFECAFDAKFNEPVYGRALGMDRLPTIPANSDFNDYITTGCYAVHRNDTSETIANIPVKRAGRLEVWASTGEGVRSEQWSYLRQRFIPYNETNAVWERDIARGDDNVWNYYEWFRSSLTPEAAEKVYSKAAISIGLTANNVLGAVNTYSKIPFNKSIISTSSRLTLSSNAICIGSNIQHIKVSGQVLVSPAATDGLRHVRIQKVSGGTTTSIAWSTLYLTGSRHLMHVLTPLIIAVKEGDLIQMVFYTGNASDSISSGSAANGYQTYLTVEEL